MGKSKDSETAPVTLDTLGGGVAHEHFERMWLELLRNVHDLNTTPTEKRTLRLDFEVTPDKDRNELAVRVSPVLKVAGHVPFQATVFTVDRNGQFLSTDQTPKQEELFPEPKDVIAIDGPKAEGGDK